MQFHHIEVWCPYAFSSGAAFRFGRVDGGSFNGLLAYQCQPAIEIYTDTDAGGGTFTGSFLNCAADACTTGVSITGDHNVKITAGDWDCHNYGAVINGTNAQVTIVGGKWHANSQQAVLVNQAGNVVVDACVFYRSATVSNPLVWVANCVTATINSCQFLSGSTGLELDNQVQRAVVTGNSFEAGGIINNMTSGKQILANNLLP